jgi:hypothetical protein
MGHRRPSAEGWQSEAEALTPDELLHWSLPAAPLRNGSAIDPNDSDGFANRPFGSFGSPGARELDWTTVHVVRSPIPEKATTLQWAESGGIEVLELARPNPRRETRQVGHLAHDRRRLGPQRHRELIRVDRRQFGWTEPGGFELIPH